MKSEFVKDCLPAKPPKVMVSFSSNDSVWVDSLEADLASLGLSLWRYEHSLQYQHSIEDFIASFSKCDFAFVMLSSSYFESDICMLEIAQISMSPSKAILISVPPDGGKAPDMAAAAVLRVSSIDSVSGSRGDWVKDALSKINWIDVKNRLNVLFANRFMPANMLTESAGRREYLATMGYTPKKFAARLDEILSMEELARRESAFDEYLETGFRGEVFLYAKAASYEKAGYYDLSLNCLRQALLASPGYAAAFICACRIAASTKGEIQRSAFELIGSFDLDGACLDTDDRADALHAQGLLAFSEYERGRGSDYLRKAYSLLQESLTLVRKSSTVNAVGQVLERLRETSRARDMYIEAVEIDNSNYAAHNNLGLLLLRREGKADEARSEFKRALECHPGYELALNGYALASEDAHPDEALFAYFALAGKDYLSSHAFTNAALLAEEEFKEFHTARALYKLALERNPTGLATNYNYATFLRRTGADAAMVEKYLNRARSAGPSLLVDVGFALLEIRDERYRDALLMLKTVGEPESEGGKQLLRFLKLYASYRMSDVGECLAQCEFEREVDFWPYGDLVARLLIEGCRRNAMPVPSIVQVRM